MELLDFLRKNVDNEVLSENIKIINSDYIFKDYNIDVIEIDNIKTIRID